MKKPNIRIIYKLIGVVFILGGILVPLGELLRPVEINERFVIDDFIEIEASMMLWETSFQILIIGLFTRLGGLIALGSLLRVSLSKVILFPGIAIASAALIFAIMSQGFYLHLGHVTTDPALIENPEKMEVFLIGLKPVGHWIFWLDKMGHLFFCFGLLAIGLGLFTERALNFWPGIFAFFIGITGIFIFIFFPGLPAIFGPVSVAITIWFVFLGFSLMVPMRHNGKEEV